MISEFNEQATNFKELLQELDSTVLKKENYTQTRRQL